MDNVLDVLLQRFEAATQAGYVNVGGATISILWLLAGIAVALAVVWNMFGGKTPWMALFSKFVLIGFFAWLVEAWPAVVDQIHGTFIQVGSMVGGSSVDFTTPSTISAKGTEVAGAFFKAASDTPFGWFKQGAFSAWLNDWLAFTVAGWAVQLGYWLVALIIAFSQVVFYISSILALFMTAFMVFTGTAWMGRGALGWLVSSGVMLMTITAITSIMLPIFNGLAYDTVDVWAANQALLASFAMLALIVGAGKIAQGIGNGAASWGMGAAISTAGMAAVGVGAAAAGAAMIAGPAARAGMAQMSASRAAAGAGPKITMNSPASYASAGKIADMSVSGRTASAMGGKASFAAQSPAPSTASAASGSQASSRGLRQLESSRSSGRPGAISSIMIARAAVPEIADDGPSMQPSNVG